MNDDELILTLNFCKVLPYFTRYYRFQKRADNVGVKVGAGLVVHFLNGFHRRFLPVMGAWVYDAVVIIGYGDYTRSQRYVYAF